MNTVLQFSGGKDSLACLYLFEQQWDEILVVWLNTGAVLPEGIAFMERIRERVPHFLEIKSQQTISERGWPADLVPTRETSLGQLATGKWPKEAPYLFQSRFDCCAATLWHPLHQAMKQVSAKVVIRGQKRSDAMRSPLIDGQKVDGIEYQFPLEHWSDAEVERFLRERDLAPICGEFIPNSSLDCWNCTAYLDESGPKLEYLKAHHPKKHAQVMEVLGHLSKAIRYETQALNNMLEPL
jgi:3'-phosphoadenosine 5'-phosphosulfate sulfotransferase (PAPS reductase)/FAD synthetase